ncbi:hypothetical protein EON67_06040, partial [archaeon]
MQDLRVGVECPSRLDADVSRLASTALYRAAMNATVTLARTAGGGGAASFSPDFGSPASAFAGSVMGARGAGGGARGAASAGPSASSPASLAAAIRTDVAKALATCTP